LASVPTGAAVAASAGAGAAAPAATEEKGKPFFYQVNLFFHNLLNPSHFYYYSRQERGKERRIR